MAPAILVPHPGGTSTPPMERITYIPGTQLAFPTRPYNPTSLSPGEDCPTETSWVEAIRTLLGITLSLLIAVVRVPAGHSSAGKHNKWHLNVFWSQWFQGGVALTFSSSTCHSCVFHLWMFTCMHVDFSKRCNTAKGIWCFMSFQETVMVTYAGNRLTRMSHLNTCPEFSWNLYIATVWNRIPRIKGIFCFH